MQLYTALCAWAGATGLPVYAEDAVPGDTGFPFMTMRVEPPMRMADTGSVVLTAWHRGRQAHADRLETAGTLLALVPQGGTLLHPEGALAALYPGDGAVSWPESPGALGVRVRFSLRLYHPNKEDHNA